MYQRVCFCATLLWSDLAKLRHRIHRFKKIATILTKLRSPHLDQALTFLDDNLLPATSNAVERGNRRRRDDCQRLSQPRAARRPSQGRLYPF